MRQFQWGKRQSFQCKNKSTETKKAHSVEWAFGLGRGPINVVPYFKESLNSGEGRNPTVLLAGMLMTAPVWGLRPLRALRDRTVHVPKPGNVNRLSFLIPLERFSNKLSHTSLIAALESSRCLRECATFSINSAFVMDYSF